MQKKILIFGGSSLAGSHLIHYFWDKARIVTTYHSSPIKIQNIMSLPIDLTNRDAAEKLIHVTKPDIVIYASTINSLKNCQDNSKLADHLNNASPVSISYACEKRGIQFVFISSCFVFSGETGNYKEIENAKPINILGNGITSAEYSIQKNSSNYLILRVPPIFGRTASFGKMSMLEYIETNLFNGKASSLDNKVVTNYLSGHILSKLVYICIEMGISNRILHLASPDSMTRFQFGQSVAKILNKPVELINSRNQDFPVDENKAQFIETKYKFTLDAQNAQLLFENAIPPIEDQIQNYYQLNWLSSEKTNSGNKVGGFI
jgi:dTDP-4-dehydrorhamnose reductase